MSRHPVALGGAGGGTGTVTHTAGNLTANAAVFGNGAADVKVDSLITTDGSGNLTAVSFTASGTGAAYTQWTTAAFAVGAAGTVKCGAFTGNVFGCSDNGGTVTSMAMIAGDLGGTQGSEQVIAAHFTGDVAFGTTFGSITVPNAGATGTTVNLLAKINASGNAVLPATTDTGIPMMGVVTSGAGTAGSAHIAVMGEAVCVADNVVTTGDTIGVGTTTAGRCKSVAAAGTSPASGLTVIGTAMTGAAAGSSITVWLTPESAFATQNGSVASGTSGQLAWYSATGSNIVGNANATVSSGALTLGVANTTAGSVLLNGGTSGTVTLNTPAAAGSGSWSFGGAQLLSPSLGTTGAPAFALTANTGIYGSGTNVGITSNATGTAIFSSSIGTVASSGIVSAGCLMLTTTNTDIQLCRVGAANPTWGQPAASPTSYTHNMAGSSRGGTDTNVAGANATIQAGIGTGNGAGSQLVLNRNLMGATGTTAQTVANAFGVCESKTLSNTTATLTTLATIGLASNSAGGASGVVTVTCTDGTNFDSDTVSFNVSFVNKAGVLTIGTAAITTTTAANNSGSCTTGVTVTSGASLININVTPVFTTIVPTTVTGYLNITAAHGAGAITCK